MKKLRLDHLLVARGLFPSREQAQRAIMAGEVKVGTRVASKASELTDEQAELTTKGRRQFVSRGGIKLQGALDHFKLDVTGTVALDIGASTGGFTDCLLQRGAAKVYAVDVGHDQLAWKIRNDPRVIVLEKINARELSQQHVPQKVDLCVIDVSFISLTLILSPAFASLRLGGHLLALIKPQFELQRGQVGRGGVVRDPTLHKEAQRKVSEFVEAAGQEVIGVVPSTITGAEGNQEFFVCVRKRSA